MSDAVRETVDCLRDLVRQIEAGQLTDELGHDFRLNDAYQRAIALLERIEAEGSRGACT